MQLAFDSIMKDYFIFVKCSFIVDDFAWGQGETFKKWRIKKLC